jgi:hypothetical protein
VDSSGVARTIPPSLIAPFFDDLALVPNVSSVSSRVLGDAPNRQFVIQWTGLTILDEDGRDLNASLTFEVVLFEGSNDIQFQYKSAKGARADGSSATIGLQNLSRDKAVLTSFNQSKVTNNFYLTYRFNLGGYNTAEGDLTAPSKPIVTDAGALTSSRTELYASWSSQDPESGIREYQYAIGRGPGATDVVPFTRTTQNSAVVSNLSLDAGSTYYFAVRAVNNAGLVSEVGVSDGIRVDPTFTPDIKIVPAAPVSSTEFSGIALYAPAAMSVVLKAFDANGSLASGSRVQNPVTLSLIPGQQYARMIQDLFGLTSFDGWIEIEASNTGLGVYTATGSMDMRLLDGTVAPDLSSDFVVFHSGATVTLVNPTSRTANVTIGDISGSNVRAVTIGPLSKFVTTIGTTSRIRSSERLSSIERFGGPSKLAILPATPSESRQLSMAIPAAVTGPGYVSWLTLANVTSLGLEATVYFAGFSRVIHFEPNSSLRVPLADWLQIPGDATRTGAVRVDSGATVFGPRASIVGAVDIETPVEMVSISSRPPTTEFLFTQVMQGNGFYTALCIATGATPATVTVDVYANGDDPPQSATLMLAANQQVDKQISEIVTAVRNQTGGFIRVHSDQPIWIWEIYGSDRMLAGSPPAPSTALLPLRRSPLPSPSR